MEVRWVKASERTPNEESQDDCRYVVVRRRIAGYLDFDIKHVTDDLSNYEWLDMKPDPIAPNQLQRPPHIRRIEL